MNYTLSMYLPDDLQSDVLASAKVSVDRIRDALEKTHITKDKKLYKTLTSRKVKTPYFDVIR